MELVAKATENNASLMQRLMHKQMRAYVAVDVGDATYQDEKLRFAASVTLRNSGYTPAKNITYTITADILDSELSKDFEFKDYGVKTTNDATLSPRQDFAIRGIVSDRVAEDQVSSIKAGDGKNLYVWGTVSYEDIFSNHWYTNFCYRYAFFANANNEYRVSTNYNPRHNDST